MNALDSQHLFYSCPYPVKSDEEEYTFKTDHDIVYAVSFKEETFFDPIPAYWFDLMNRSHRPSPNDPKVPKNHPYLEDIISRFDAEIAMFKEK